MRALVKKIKDRVVQAYDYIKALEEIPMRGFQGEFYEEKPQKVRVKRQNQVRVEDLRPPRQD